MDTRARQYLCHKNTKSIRRGERIRKVRIRKRILKVSSTLSHFLISYSSIICRSLFLSHLRMQNYKYQFIECRNIEPRAQNFLVASCKFIGRKKVRDLCSKLKRSKIASLFNSCLKIGGVGTPLWGRELSRSIFT